MSAILGAAWVGPEHISVTDSKLFCAGGIQRSTALSGWSVDQEGRPVWASEGPLGPLLDEHCRSYDPVVLGEIVECVQNGANVRRMMDPAYLARVQPQSAKLRSDRRHRSLAGHRNAKICGHHARFLAEQVMPNLRAGVLRCEGRIEDCVAEGRVPDEVNAVTVEPTKPRACTDTRVPNQHTRSMPCVLEGNH